MEDTDLSNILLPQDEQLDLAVAYKNQNPLISIHNIVYIYNVPHSTLGHRIKGC
jgi:hypothetical protein